MIRNACLPADHHMVAGFATPGDPDLRDENVIFANLDVMRDLHQIIDFGAAPDDGFTERGAVHRDVCTEFHVVLDDDSADLRDLSVSSSFL